MQSEEHILCPQSIDIIDIIKALKHAKKSVSSIKIIEMLFKKTEVKAMKNKSVKNIALSAMFIAIGYVLPFLTGQIPQIGNMLLPMHIPVFLCALICGWKYGLAVGLILPLLRSLILGMPPLYPIAIAMTFEMATYGFVAGFHYEKSRWKCLVSLYRSMLIAMVAGRLVWGAAEIVLLGIRSTAFTWQAFISGALLNAIPGIIIQLILVPAIMLALSKTKFVVFSKRPRKAVEKNTV